MIPVAVVPVDLTLQMARLYTVPTVQQVRVTVLPKAVSTTMSPATLIQNPLIGLGRSAESLGVIEVASLKLF